MDRMENMLVKIDEKYSKSTSSLDSRLKKIEDKGDLNVEEHVNEIEDLVLLMQLEIAKVKEKIGGIELGFLPSGEVHSRIDELEEKIKNSPKTEENVEIVKLDEDDNNIEKNTEISNIDNSKIDDISKKIEEHKEIVSSELYKTTEHVGFKISEIQSILNNEIEKLSKRIEETETKQGIELRNTVDLLGKKMPNLDNLNRKIEENNVNNKIEFNQSIDSLNRKIEEVRSQILTVYNESRDVNYKVENRLKQMENNNVEERIAKLESFIEKEFSELDKRIATLEDNAYNNEEPNKSYTILNDVQSILRR